MGEDDEEKLLLPEEAPSEVITIVHPTAPTTQQQHPSAHRSRLTAKNLVVGREDSADRSFRTAVLLWLTVQNAIHTLLIRYSRAREVDEMFKASVAVFMTEVIKTIICLGVILWQEGPMRSVSLLRSQTFGQPWDTLKVCVPAMLYIVQNNLFYVAASHLEAATFMVSSQLKIFTTALFSVVLLRRSLSGTQWAALGILFAGVSLVQLQSTSDSASSGRIGQSPSMGFLCILIACCLSGFAGVYFEKILKGAAPVSLWMRNIQMAIFSIPSSLFSVFAQDGDFIAEHGFLYGWDGVVWMTAFWYGVGGLSVAVCIKYADNIAKNFATSVAILLSTLGSMYFFDFSPSLMFTSGAALVILSIFTYSSSSTFLSGLQRAAKYNLCI